MSTTNGMLLLPSAKQIVLLMSPLLGRTTKVDLSSAELPIKPPYVVGVYVADDNTIVALCFFDLALACHLGAALSMIPAAVASEAARKGVVSESISENLFEVANVMSSLFNHDGGVHVRLREVVHAPKVLPAQFSDLLKRPAARSDFSVSIQGYGAGPMAIVAVA